MYLPAKHWLIWRSLWGQGSSRYSIIDNSSENRRGKTPEDFGVLLFVIR